ncbi:Deoxyuridine 5'-triphosphate nucleotidohydrolase, mitochondrial, partial [Ophiophagus hannah]
MREAERVLPPRNPLLPQIPSHTNQAIRATVLVEEAEKTTQIRKNPDSDDARPNGKSRPPPCSHWLTGSWRAHWPLVPQAVPFQKKKREGFQGISLVFFFPSELAAFLRAFAMPVSTIIPGESSSAGLGIPNGDTAYQSLRFVKLTENAFAPSKGSSRAAGYDLYSSSIWISSGVIDEDYRGNVGVVLFNFGKEPFKVKKGDRIAQLICERIYYPVLEEVKVLDETERGSGGFGSTGQK